MSPVYCTNTLVIDFRDILSMGLDYDRLTILFRSIGGYYFPIRNSEVLQTKEIAEEIFKAFKDWKLSEFRATERDKNGY